MDMDILVDGRILHVVATYSWDTLGAGYRLMMVAHVSFIYAL